jgi:hypothetical protein
MLRAQDGKSDSLSLKDKKAVFHRQEDLTVTFADKQVVLLGNSNPN